MAFGKEFIKAKSFSCNQDELIKAIEDAISIIGLKTKESKFDNEQIYFLASEKLKFLSTNWPASYNIVGKRVDGGYKLIVKCWAKMTSITQDRYTEKKTQEFIDLVKDSGSLRPLSEKSDTSESNLSILEKLAELKEKGIITEEEFKEQKNKLLSDL